jgi:hypothetical protein
MPRQSSCIQGLELIQATTINLTQHKLLPNYFHPKVSTDSCSVKTLPPKKSRLPSQRYPYISPRHTAHFVSFFKDYGLKYAAHIANQT